MAKLLEKKYGWRIIDWMDIVANRMNELKSEYENEHHPNNPAAEDRRIGLSEHEWTEIINGKLIDSWKFFPWIYQHIGLPLEKKRPPPAPPVEQVDGIEEQ